MPTMAEMLPAVGRETLAVSTSAVGFANIPDNARVAVVQVEDDSVRVDFTEDPTASQGYQLFVGDSFEIWTWKDLNRARFIRVTTDASLEIIYFGDGG